MQNKSVLVAPLDWGLGHATRCIPIIQLLLKKGNTVHIASSGDALMLLRNEFPELTCFQLPSYRPLYSKHLPFMINIFWQIPKFLDVIAREKKEIQRLCKNNHYDLLISDNRYGCRSSKVKSIFIGHQINIIMPGSLKWFAPIINYFNHKWILRFDQCWIPDESNQSLTGRLTHPLLPRSKKIGILSRFTKKKEVKLKYQLAVVLSGPEPQRTILEQKLLSQLAGFDIDVILVRGLVGEAEALKVPANVTVFNYQNSDQLCSIIEESEWVISRSGYTTVMDMMALSKRVIFIPTPGQTEQEFLAAELMKKKIAYSQSQDELDLKLALLEIKNYTGFVDSPSQPNLLEEAIEEVLK